MYLGLPVYASGQNAQIENSVRRCVSQLCEQKPKKFAQKRPTTVYTMSHPRHCMILRPDCDRCESSGESSKAVVECMQCEEGSTTLSLTFKLCKRCSDLIHVAGPLAKHKLTSLVWEECEVSRNGWTIRPLGRGVGGFNSCIGFFLQLTELL